MGLNDWLARQAVAGVHVLVVEVPGAWEVRVSAEQAMQARGWHPALSPADADALLVCGAPGSQLRHLLDDVWQLLPGPRARATVLLPDRIGDALDQIATLLLDAGHQRADAHERPLSPVDAGNDAGNDGGNAECGHEEHADQGGHAHTDMSGPGGIALASGGPDRDGLQMDVLRVPLGPVLPHWPPGLVLRCTLHGDVVMAAETEGVDHAADRSLDLSDAVLAAQYCDDAAALLTLSGWQRPAADARRLRDRLLSGVHARQIAFDVERLSERVRRSWLLRWSLRGLGVVDDTALSRHRLGERARGDARDRLLAMLTAAAGHAAEDAPLATAHPDAAALSDLLQTLVIGHDLAGARLVVSSFAPELRRVGVAISDGTTDA